MAELRGERRMLLAGGALLVLLGLLTGLAVGAFANPRMALSAHLEGILNGVVLLALGGAWHHLALPRRWRTAALALVLYGSIANWLSTTLAAAWGTGRLTPIASAGRVGADLHEAIVGFGLLSLSAAMIAAFAILAAGFWRGR